MFSGCSSLEKVDLSGLDTSNVETMAGMFSKCSSLKSIDFGNINTKSLKSIDLLFSDCYSLTSLDLSSLDFSKVVYKHNVFENCYGLSSIKLGEKTGDISDSMGLANFGWVNEKDPDVKVSGDEEFAFIQNTGVNTYTYNKIPEDKYGIVCFTENGT